VLQSPNIFHCVYIAASSPSFLLYVSNICWDTWVRPRSNAVCSQVLLKYIFYFVFISSYSKLCCLFLCSILRMSPAKRCYLPTVHRDSFILSRFRFLEIAVEPILLPVFTLLACRKNSDQNVRAIEQVFFL
jgi:hypothetical protein